MIETQTDIEIHSSGQWFFRGEPIQHGEILNYFKVNLRKTPDGRFYILNRFGEKVEHAFLRFVKGFPLSAVHTTLGADDQIVFTLDSGDEYTVEPDDLLLLDGETPVFFINKDDSKIPVLCTYSALAAIEHRFQENGSSCYEFLKKDGTRVSLTGVTFQELFGTEGSNRSE